MAGCVETHCVYYDSANVTAAVKNADLTFICLGTGMHTFTFMTKMAAKPIYDINLPKIFFSRTDGPISSKLGM